MKQDNSAPDRVTAALGNTTPPAAFEYILFERVNPERNESRYYYLSLQPTLFDSLAVIRVYGRKGQSQREVTPTPVSDLADAWPLIRRVIRTRLRHGYKIQQYMLDTP
jgi:predicted DNA-binding WGR domain protein